MTSVTQDAELETILANSSSPIPDKHKIRVYELLNYLKGKVEERVKEILEGAKPTEEELKKGVGIAMIIALGYKKSMEKYVIPLQPDAMFKIHPMSIYCEGVEQRLYALSRSPQHDGAVLISTTRKDAHIIGNSMNIEVPIGKTLTKHGVDNHRPLSERLEIGELGNGRAYSKTLSYEMKDALIFKMSQGGELMVFENKETICSPKPGEITVRRKEIAVPRYTLTTRKGVLVPATA